MKTIIIEKDTLIKYVQQGLNGFRGMMLRPNPIAQQALDRHIYMNGIEPRECTITMDSVNISFKVEGKELKQPEKK